MYHLKSGGGGGGHIYVDSPSSNIYRPLEILYKRIKKRVNRQTHGRIKIRAIILGEYFLTAYFRDL